MPAKIFELITGRYLRANSQRPFWNNNKCTFGLACKFHVLINAKIQAYIKLIGNNAK